MPTHEELKVFSGEHLCHEIGMLYEVTLKLVRREADQITGNALIESFGIHAAIILGFMFNKKDKKDDAIANDYVVDQIKWKKIVSSYRKKLNFIYLRRNKELAHLSYERLEVTAITKQWSFVAICREISDLVDYFIEMSDKTITHPNILVFKNYFRNNPLCKLIPNFDRIPLIVNPENLDSGTPVVIYIPPAGLEGHVLVH